jgi:hypothetical protein
MSLRTPRHYLLCLLMSTQVYGRFCLRRDYGGTPQRGRWVHLARNLSTFKNSPEASWLTVGEFGERPLAETTTRRSDRILGMDRCKSPTPCDICGYVLFVSNRSFLAPDLNLELVFYLVAAIRRRKLLAHGRVLLLHRRAKPADRVRGSVGINAQQRNGDSMDVIEKQADLATHFWGTYNRPREVKTNGTSLILYRCPRCAREFAREPDQSAWRAVHVGVFRVEFLDNAANRRWISEPCPGRLPEDERVPSWILRKRRSPASKS